MVDTLEQFKDTAEKGPFWVDYFPHVLQLVCSSDLKHHWWLFHVVSRFLNAACFFSGNQRIRASKSISMVDSLEQFKNTVETGPSLAGHFASILDDSFHDETTQKSTAIPHHISPGSVALLLFY